MAIGIGNALGAFNIGRQGGAAESPAIGMAIRQIVEQGDKLAITQGQSEAQTAGALAGAQFKHQLSDQPKSIIQIDPSGRRNVLNVPGRTQIQGAPQQINIGQAVGETLRPDPGPDRTFNLQDGQLQQQLPTPTPAPAPGLGAGGAINLEGMDPNAPLSPEVEAAIRAQLGLPPI